MKTYVCAGIGDFLCLDCFLTQDERNSITEIYWGSRFGKDIASSIENNFFYPNVKKQYFIDDETGKKYWCELNPGETHNWTFWHFRSDIPEHYKKALEHYGLKQSDVQDFTPISFFNDVNRNYTGSSFINNASRTDFNFQEKEIKLGKYLIVHYPTSSRPRNDIAKITQNDWDFIKNISREKELPVIVITDTELDFLNNTNFLVLVKPSMKELMALIKFSGYYFGCDSFVSILCSKILASNKLVIKSPRSNIKEILPGHIWNHKYFSPHKPNIIQKFYHYEPCG